ncbi:MAG: PHB depolymerase family esterase [Actinomycetota bacterium]
MSSHQIRFGRWLLALALFAATIGSLAVGGDAALAASKAHCTSTIEAGTHVLEVDGYDVLLYVPESAAKKHVPLVVNLHGSGSTGAQMLADEIVNWDGAIFSYGGTSAADANGFAVLAPTGVAAPMFSGYQWNVPGVPLFQGLPLQNDRDDVEFIEHAIDAAADAMCIDLARVYATGLSGGARMASQLACDLADRLAAVAPIAGIRFPLESDAALGLPDSADCDPARQIPILTIHGLLDPVNVWADTPPDVDPGWTINPVVEGTSWSYSGETAVARWVEHNSCRSTPRVTTMTDNIDLVEYRACHNNADVTVVMVNDGGHTIPGYPLPWAPGQANMEVDGNEVAWDLLASYRLPGKYVAALSK